MTDSAQIIDDAITAHRTLPGAVLHAIRDALGLIPPVHVGTASWRATPGFPSPPPARGAAAWEQGLR